MKRKIELLEFLKTGHLHTIKPGDTRRQVFEALGPPDDHDGSNQHWRASIWKYAGLELHFTEEQNAHILWLIWCDYIPIPHNDSASIALHPWLLAERPHVNANTIKAALLKADIPHNISPSEHTPHTETITFHSGVSLGIEQRNNTPVITFIRLSL